MNIEYEAKFLKIDKGEFRKKLNSLGAKLVRAERLMRRSAFHLPKGLEVYETFVRVRDEGDKVTMSIKSGSGKSITDQKEICLKIDSFDNAILFLENLGCTKKSYQETMREEWELDDAVITIDTWPFLETYAEIEANSEEKVKVVSEKLGFVWRDAFWGGTALLIAQKYGRTEDEINNQTPLIVFGDKNPYVE
jgi:adenylate cyclase class 2